jgi:hypothetical protein
MILLYLRRWLNYYLESCCDIMFCTNITTKLFYQTEEEFDDLFFIFNQRAFYGYL